MSYETHTVNTLTVNIDPDDDPANPREAFDNLGIMVCFHRRYILGDKHDHTDPEDFFDYLTREALTPEQAERRNRIQGLINRIDGYYTNDTWGPKAIYLDRYYRLEEELVRLKEEALSNYIILPLYLYEHSGITMSTGQFSCPWDSGQVGWIYMTLETARKNWPSTTDLKDRAEQYLKGEVHEYAMYLEGDCWGYSILDADEVDIESCWGFYGLDVVREEALAAARSIAASLPKQHELSF